MVQGRKQKNPHLTHLKELSKLPMKYTLIFETKEVLIYQILIQYLIYHWLQVTHFISPIFGWCQSHLAFGQHTFQRFAKNMMAEAAFDMFLHMVI